MTTQDPSAAIDAPSARAVIEAATSGPAGHMGFGLEAEFFPIEQASVSRIPIEGPAGILQRLSTLADTQPALKAPGVMTSAGWMSDGASGFRISFEPGGQIEISSSYQPTITAAIAETDEAVATIAAALEQSGVVLAATGIDLWSPGTVPQQLSASRYVTMDRHFNRLGAAGRTMMRDTCALQLNLDLSSGLEAQKRWATANLLAPVATATFAASPTPDGRVRCQRSINWQQVDPSRTGFPQHATSSTYSIADQYEQFAMNATVLPLNDGTVDHQALPHDWRFGDWMTRGHPQFGWPTVEDFTTHLSTLFPEVRPRGFLEIRSIDALPKRWRRVPAVLYAGAIYDPKARDRIHDLLADVSETSAQQLHLAATSGLSDATLCARAVEVWSFALSGAMRLPQGTFADGDLQSAEAYLDRFTLRGLSPADELITLLQTSSPSAVLGWALEPLREPASAKTVDTRTHTLPAVARESR
ncbi:MAG: glutamate-cysteine ligase family protein [Nitriliruptoraceae bacterium]